MTVFIREVTNTREVPTLEATKPLRVDIGKELVMRKGVARIATAVVAGSVLALSGAGMASADSVDRASGGAGAVTTSPETSADAVQKLRDRLAVRADKGDYAGTRSTVRDVTNVLSALQKRSEPWAARAEVRSSVTESIGLSTEFGKKLDTAIQARQVPGGGSLLGTLNGLLQSLLGQLSSLLDGLLGGGAPPVPVPEPELPETPEPELPETPEP